MDHTQTDKEHRVIHQCAREMRISLRFARFLRCSYELREIVSAYRRASSVRNASMISCLALLISKRTSTISSALNLQKTVSNRTLSALIKMIVTFQHTAECSEAFSWKNFRTERKRKREHSEIRNELVFHSDDFQKNAERQKQKSEEKFKKKRK